MGALLFYVVTGLVALTAFLAVAAALVWIVALPVSMLVDALRFFRPAPRLQR